MPSMRALVFLAIAVAAGYFLGKRGMLDRFIPA